MRVAIISDIHGNAVALDHVLSHLRREEPDRIVCLGDVAATGPQPVVALERVRELSCPVVMGNTDEWLLNPVVDEDADESLRRIQEIDAWCAEQLSAAHERFVESFAETVEVRTDDDVRLCCYHGSPRSHSEGIEATTPETELDEWFADTEADVMIGGHTHVQLFRRHRDAIVLNPGSVGLPHELDRAGEIRHPPWAEWAMVTTSNGTVRVELRRTPVDREAVVQAARESDVPHAGYWTDGWTN